MTENKEGLKTCPFCSSAGRKYYDQDFYACSNQECPAYELVCRFDEWQSRSIPEWLASEEALSKYINEFMSKRHGFQYDGILARDLAKAIMNF